MAFPYIVNRLFSYSTFSGAPSQQCAFHVQCGQRQRVAIGSKVRPQFSQFIDSSSDIRGGLDRLLSCPMPAVIEQIQDQ